MIEDDAIGDLDGFEVIIAPFFSSAFFGVLHEVYLGVPSN